MRLDDMVLVSVDDHVVEPPDMFDGRLPAEYADVAPACRHARTTAPTCGRTRAARSPTSALNAVAGRPPEEYGMEPTSFDEIRAGCYDIDERVRDMDANGVLGSMCFPSFPNLCGQLFARIAGQGRRRSPCSGPTTTGTSTSGAARTRAASSRSRCPPIWDPQLHGRRGAPRRPRRAATPSPSRRTRRSWSCRASTPTTGTRSGRRAATRARSSACTSARRPRS